MPLTDAQLTAELTTDPLGLGYAALTDVPAADLLNTTKTPVTLTFLDQGAVLVLANKMKANKFSQLAQGQTVSEPVTYAVDALMPDVAKQEGLDLTQPQVKAMIGAFKQMGLLSDDDEALVTAGELTRAEVLGGRGAVVDWSDVARVRNAAGRG